MNYQPCTMKLTGSLDILGKEPQSIVLIDTVHIIMDSVEVLRLQVNEFDIVMLGQSPQLLEKIL